MRFLPLADDCGISPGADATILRCIEAGRLCGTSVMAGAPHAAKAGETLGRRLSRDPELRIGAHLNLLEGRCAAPAGELPLLVNERGEFKHNLASLWAALALGSRRNRAALLQQIAREWQAQVEAVRGWVAKGFGRESGFSLYLDGHLHVHVLPAVRPVLLELAAAFPPRHVRLLLEPRHLPPAPPALRLKGALRRELLTYWSRPLRGQLRARGIPTPDAFVGAYCSGSMTGPRLEASLAAVRKTAGPDALVELMFHPGGFSGDERARLAHLPYAAFYTSPERRVEAELLLSPAFARLLDSPPPSGGKAAEETTA